MKISTLILLLTLSFNAFTFSEGAYLGSLFSRKCAFVAGDNPNKIENIKNVFMCIISNNAHNGPGLSFVAIDDTLMLSKLCECFGQINPSLDKSQFCIALCVDHSASETDSMTDYSQSAISNMMFCANEIGMCSYLVTGNNIVTEQVNIKAMLNVPDGVLIAGIVFYGYKSGLDNPPTPDNYNNFRYNSWFRYWEDVKKGE
jgi:hypothetical protein